MPCSKLEFLLNFQNFSHFSLSISLPDLLSVSHRILCLSLYVNFFLVCLSVSLCLYVCQSMSVCLLVCVCMSVIMCPQICQSLSVCLLVSVCMSVSLSLYVSQSLLFLPACQSLSSCQLVSVYVLVSVWLIVCLSVHLVSYPMLTMTHPSRNFFVLSLFCVYACLYG